MTSQPRKSGFFFSHGFTLVEIILYIGMASSLLILTSLFLSWLLQSRVKNQTIANVEQQGFQAMHLIAQTARNAEAVTIPRIGANASFLEIDVVNSNNDPTVFDLADNMIRITEGDTPPVSLTNNRVTASSFLIQNVSRSGTPGSIRVQFTLRSVNPESRNEYAFEKTFIGSATLRQP